MKWPKTVWGWLGVLLLVGVVGAGGLDDDIAVVKHGRDDAFGRDGNILDAVNMKFRDLPVEEAELVSLDDAPVGDDDGV